MSAAGTTVLFHFWMPDQSDILKFAVSILVTSAIWFAVDPFKEERVSKDVHNQ